LGGRSRDSTPRQTPANEANRRKAVFIGKDDINQEIKVPLSNEKLRSKEELDIEIKRQLPVFLEIINHKRREKNEPKIDNNQIIASTFLDIEDHKNIEIIYASEIYIPVMKRLVEEARMKIKELIRNN